MAFNTAVFIAIMIAFAVWSYLRKSIALSGAIAMVIMTTSLAIMESWLVITAMGGMFISSSVLTKWRKEQKQKTTEHILKHYPRNAAQAFANLGVAFIFACMAEGLDNTDLLLFAVGAIAAANSDTWASEIGVLSRTKPKYILSRQFVDAGLSGGVTPLGVFASIFGSAFVAAIFFFFSQRMSLAILVCLAGFVGAIMDSILGELIQVKYKNHLGTFTEINQKGTTAKGWSFVNNDVVNFLCSITGAMTVFLGRLFL